MHLVLVHPLSNIEITKYFNNKPRFNAVFLRNNWSRIRNGVYEMNLDDKKSKGIQWVLLFIDRNGGVYRDSFGIEHIPQEVLNNFRDKSITHNLFRIQDSYSIMCRLFCIDFIEYMLAGKTLLDHTNLFSPNDYKKNNKIICKYSKDKYVKSWI